MLRLIQRRVVRPVLELLRVGASPERLAWSLAVGAVVGMNPLLGSTTVVVLALATAFKLNHVASQIGNHAMYPLELLLFPVFLKLGSVVFRTEGIPLSRGALMESVKHHPWATTQLLWRWEWHALVVWAVCAVVVTPLLAWAMRPALDAMARKMQRGVASL
jgi:uncharacterized protein (DUF2062 family)